jgi:hypothetical protein
MPVSSVQLVISDTLSSVLGIIGGFYCGQSDARGTDIRIFETITTNFCEFMFGGLARATKIQLSKEEIENYRKKWFDPAIEDIRAGRVRNRNRGILLIIIALVIFSISHLIAGSS